MIISQSPLMMFIIYVGVFLGVLLAFDGIRQLLSRAETTDTARNRRMRMIKKGASTDEVLNLLLADTKSRKSERKGLVGLLRLTLRQSGARFGLFGFGVIVVGLFTVALAISASVLPPQTALLAALGISPGMPMAGLILIRRSRLNKMLTQLPDALELMARGLTVGHPLNVTVNSVATDMPDPIGTEFGIIQDQVSYGDDISTAFASFAERVHFEDARYLAVSVGIQQGSGGNLARVLKVLSKVIRDRTTMRRRIKAISSEGRLSAIILTLLPFMIFGSIMLTTPSFYLDVMDDPLFKPVAGFILGLVALQAIILNRMVNFKF